MILIEKQTKDIPALAFMDGKLNGVGGKMKPHETAHCAMAREFEEETGVATHRDAWKCFGQMEGESGWTVYLFAIRISDEQAEDCHTVTEEEVMNASIESITTWLSDQIVPNLAWLIPMALDAEIKYGRIALH